MVYDGRMTGAEKPAGGSRLNPTSNRFFSPDALRGLIIVFMALDHANYFIAQKHSPGEYWGGPFSQYSSALPFLTRFVTHLSAPGFFFLMGVGMLLFTRSRETQGWSQPKIAAHFLLRGLLLIALQLLVVNRAWELSPTWVLEIYVGVLFALGLTMIIASLFLWLPPRLLLALAFGFFIGTELLVPDPAAWSQPRSPLERILLTPGGDRQLWANYPALPWLELVLFGIAFGAWLHKDPRRAYRRALFLGGVFLVALVPLRALNGFGNIRPIPTATLIDFLNPVKYPPSLAFTLLTTGLNLLLLFILLFIFSRLKQTGRMLLEPLQVFGSAPLFFYLTHLFLYAFLGRLVVPHGTTLARMFPYWLLGLLVLYPLCRWYAVYKRSQPSGSILHYF